MKEIYELLSKLFDTIYNKSPLDDYRLGLLDLIGILLGKLKALDDNSIADQSFRLLVAKMRKAQVDYFTGGRKHSDLFDAKRLEKLVDEQIKIWLDQPAIQRPTDQPQQENLFTEIDDAKTE